MKKIITLAMLFITTVLAAQPSMDSQRYRIDYVNESYLLRKGDTLTLVNLNLELPIRLNGYTTTALQSFLCKTFFNNNYENFNEGLTDYLNHFGKEIKQMPDETGLRRRYFNLELKALALQKGQFISMHTIRTYREGNQEIDDSLKNELLTYDMVTDKVLRKDDIFRWYVLNSLMYDTDLVVSILQFCPDNVGEVFQIVEDYDFYTKYEPILRPGVANVVIEDILPDKACLMPMGVLFNVPKLFDEHGLHTYSIVPTKLMYPYMKAAAKRTISGRSKREKNKLESTVTKLNDDLTIDSMFVYDYTPIMPQYDGKKEDMMAFIYRQINYPSYEKLLDIQGKVKVSFIVERDGSLSSPSVLSPVSPGLDRQAVKAVMDLPKWKPGMVDGIPVRVRMVLPISFKLENVSRGRRN